MLFSGLGSDAKRVEAATWRVQVFFPIVEKLWFFLYSASLFLFVSQVSIALPASLGGE